MSIIRSLIVSLTARTDKFTRGMKGAELTVARFGQFVRNSAIAAAKLTSVLAVGGGIALAYWVKGTAEAIDKTAKLSDQLGVSTEALVGWQHGADLAGIGAEQLATSLAFFGKTMGEVRDGSTSAADGLRLLGLSAGELEGLGLEQQIDLIADRFKGLGNAQDRAAAATKLFGRAGGPLVNLLREGSAGLRAYREDAEKLGLTFSREGAAKVEQFNDALTRSRRVLTGVGRILTIEIAPYLTAAADAFNDWATTGEGAGARILSALEGVSLAIVKVINLLDKAREGWSWIALGGAHLADYLGMEVGAQAFAVTPARDRTEDVEAFFAKIRADAAARAGKPGAGANPVDDVTESVRKLGVVAQATQQAAGGLLDMLFQKSENLSESLRQVALNFVRMIAQSGLNRVVAQVYGSESP